MSTLSLPSISKKACLRALVLYLSVFISVISNASSPPSTIALSWTTTETLVAIGAPPIGMSVRDNYERWGSIRSLPEDTVEVGISFQPNLELITSMHPDIILSDSVFAVFDDKLSGIYDTYRFTIYQEDVDRWNELTNFTRKVSTAIMQPGAGEMYITEIENKIEDLKNRIREWNEPLLIIRALDSHHVRVYGKNSLVQAALDRLGLSNAWQEPTNQKGFSIIGVEELIDIDARLVIVEGPQLSGNMATQLSDRGLWQYVPSIREDNLITVPPFWVFGALPSALRFAESLVEALETPTEL
ncbi:MULTISPECIES: ABC transporter substrate-binding protein [Halomonadaceae]|uniref:ABC transporter substrate-binding protein n=1 Tax=Halomonadaceae TaxID=28256 RepID=UPI003F973BCD